MVPFPFLLPFLLFLLLILLLLLLLFQGLPIVFDNIKHSCLLGNSWISWHPIVLVPPILWLFFPLQHPQARGFFLPQRLMFPGVYLWLLSYLTLHAPTAPRRPRTFLSFHLPSTGQQIPYCSSNSDLPEPDIQSSYAVNQTYHRCSWPGWPHQRLSQPLTL